jgi:predicted nucleotidyltransferase component of viral defense system
LNDSDIQNWVQNKNIGNLEFRQATHIILHSISASSYLCKQAGFTFKGGAYLSIAIDHDRQTTAIDLSTKNRNHAEAKDKIAEELDLQIEDATYALSYPIQLAIQSYRIKPRENNVTYPTSHVTVGYANTNKERELKRLSQKQSPKTITIDFSFNDGAHKPVKVRFSSSKSEPFELSCYSLNEVVAEKFRAILQQPVRNRTRPQDLYDIHRIIEKFSSELDPIVVHTMLLKKAEGRGLEKYLHKDGLTHQDVMIMFEQGHNALSQTVETLPTIKQMLEIANPFYQSMPWSESAQ